MYIQGSQPENKREDAEREKIRGIFGKKAEVNAAEDERAEKSEALDRVLANALLHWRAPEYEKYEKGTRWYLYAALVLLAIIGYAAYTNSPVMAITFILIGVVGYIFINRDPRTIDFAVTRDGLLAGREFYDFDNIQSFWIFYEPHDIKVISLHTKGLLMPFVHIPIHEEDPVRIREVLLEYLPEVKQEPSVVDTFERLLGI